MTQPIRMVYADHNNDSGDWCPFSLVSAPADAETDDPCPQGCAASWVTEATA